MDKFMKTPHCPCIIDIEASGFGAHSYPIEIGAVKADGSRFCSLIIPQEEWLHWNPEAEAIHGISRCLLFEKGNPVKEVCHALNIFLGAVTAYSDAWVHDSPWLTRLFWAARCKPQFHLSPIELITPEQQLLAWDQTKKDLESQLKIRRHRASSDAFLIQQTWLLSREITQPSKKFY
jgi:hypothetical protein